MANKQIATLLKTTSNLCEINKEYPSLKHSSMDRHLCTSTKPLKTPESIIIHKLPNKIATDQHKNDSNKHTKHVREETEVIELFHYQQEEENNNKLYRKCRYQVTNGNNNEEEKEEKRDNTN